MAGSKTLSIKYTADANGVLRAQAQIEKSVGNLGSKLSSLGQKLYSTGRSMTVGLTLPILAGFKVAIDEITQFNQVQGQTAAAIKSTGGAANVTIGHIDRLSASLGKLTAQDAEVVHGTENILLTFPRVANEAGKTNKIFDQASLAVQNIAARMGEDASSAAVQLGKALSQPQKGLTALRRIGVTFSAEQAHQIALLSQHHKLLEAQKVILHEVAKEFAGSAREMGKNASPLTKLNLLFRDFAQKIGPIVVQIADAVNKKVEAMIQWFQGLSPHTQKLIVQAAALVAALGPLLLIIGSLIRGIGLLLTPVSALAGLFIKEAESAATAGAATEGFGLALNPVAVGVGALTVLIGGLVYEEIRHNQAMTKAQHVVAVYGEHSKEAAGSVRELGGAQVSLNHHMAEANTLTAKGKAAVDKLTQANKQWFYSVNRNVKGISDYRDVMSKANQVSEKQATKIAVLVNGYNTLRGPLSTTRKMMIQNLLAMGDATDAAKLLREWIDKIPGASSTHFLFPGLDAGIAKVREFNKLLNQHGLRIGPGGQLSGGGGGYGGPKAGGGMVTRSMTYLVGESGPELFTPSTSGSITPNSALGGTTVNVYVAGTVTAERDLVECVRKGLKQVGNRNGGRTGL